MWTRIAEQMDGLLTTPRDLALFREAVLQLAVRGKLCSEAESDVWSERTIGEFANFQNGFAFKSSWYTKTGGRLVRNRNIGHTGY